MTIFAKWRATCVVAACFTLCFAVGAPAQIPPKNPPPMTIKIFNDDPGNNYIFPVLTTGKGPVDIWMQAITRVPEALLPNFPYPRTKNYRIFINQDSTGNPYGIAPGKSITLTLPLFTQLAATPNPKLPDQFIDWWNGGTIQIYYSPTAAAPRALREAIFNNTNQKTVAPVATADRPNCVGCLNPQVKIYSDVADLPKNHPSQLLEYTLGARVQQKVVNKLTDPLNLLDVRNVDFDVSYVNVAFLSAAMGPFMNDQVGYVGSPLSIKDTQAAITLFLKDNPRWPRFVLTYADGKTKETINKIPSPLEIFARLNGVHPPPDLEPLVPPEVWPTKLWTPIEDLRAKWILYAGKVTADGGDAPTPPPQCKLSATKDTFCDAILEAKKLLQANYKKYRLIYATKCKGNPVVLNDNLMISHLYGWGPFTESREGTDGTGCPADVNLLQNSTTVYSANNFAEYARVKLLFDKLNYGTALKDPLKDQKYVFNPWVAFIHGAKYLNTPNAYAYSVDDAVGNIQADALGIRIDIGSTKNLENKERATPPITINYAIVSSESPKVQMTRYRICKDEVGRERVANPGFASFVISATNPASCPIFFFDNTGQKYTFKVKTQPPYARVDDPKKTPPVWTPATSKPIDCSGNTNVAPYQPSSRRWCCSSTGKGSGIFTYSTPEVASAHSALTHFVILPPPPASEKIPFTACNLTP